MAHRRGSFRSRGISDSQRRKKTWGQVKILVDGAETPGFVTSIGLQVGTGSVAGRGFRDGFFLLSGDGTGASPFSSTIPEESTILRIRGSVSFPKYTALATGTSNVDTAIGFGVAGISDNISTSYPAPITDADWDGWMFRRASSVSPVDSEGTVVDVKAMRKVKSGDMFFVMVEAVQGLNNVTPATFDWQVDLRILILLP